MSSFYLPTEIVTGRGCASTLAKIASRYGKHALIVCGQSALGTDGWLGRGKAMLDEAQMQVSIFDGVRGEPSLEIVDQGIALARAQGCDVVIGLGGGSAMDTAKAIAGMVAQPLDSETYHNGHALQAPSLPVITLPTTSGTGAEVTKNAVLTNTRTGLKQSIRGEDWFPVVALVDPELTRGMPPAVTASSGADALCQAIEAYTSIAASPVTDALAMQAITLIGASLERAYRDGDDMQAREGMSMGSLMAGMAMSSARLGGVHGMAHPLGARYHIPHGLVCGLLLAPTMRYNLDHATAKYASVARLMGFATKDMTESKAAAIAVEHVAALMRAVGIPEHLAPFGVREDALAPIIDESLPSGSLKHNPRPLQADDVRAILISLL